MSVPETTSRPATYDADFIVVGSGAGGGADQGLDQVDHAVAGVDVDARLRVGDPALVFRHGRPRLRGGRTLESQVVQWSGGGYTLAGIRRGRPGGG